jgi:hypothetical protein
MKRIIFLTAAFALFTMAAAAQDKAKTPNFAGVWTLDVPHSQLGERERIESQTLTVSQTAATLNATTSTKRMAPPAVTPGGQPAGSEPGRTRMGGGGGMGRMGAGDTPWTYSLDGKDTKSETQGPMGAMPVTLNAKFDGPKLNITRTSTFTTPNGDRTMTTRETWQLSDDGKTLTITAERTSMRGNESSTRVYVKSQK